MSLTRKARRELTRGRMARAVWLELWHRIRVSAAAYARQREYEILWGDPTSDHVPTGILHVNARGR